MIAATTAVSIDGRPIIEVTQFNARPGSKSVTLAGTASTYEGTVLLTVIADGDRRHVDHTQASEGGPSRGTWKATVLLPAGAKRIQVSGPEMEEGRSTAHLRTVTIELGWR